MSFRQEMDVVTQFDRIRDIPLWELNGESGKIALQLSVDLERERERVSTNTMVDGRRKGCSTLFDLFLFLFFSF
jgi:hypothetical protein